MIFLWLMRGEPAACGECCTGADSPAPVIVDTHSPDISIANYGNWWPFAGSALLFLGSLYALWRTNRNAERHHREQLDNVRNEGRLDRAAERNDKFREEIAGMLGEKEATEDAAYALADAFNDFQVGQSDPNQAPNEVFAAAIAVRDEKTPQLVKVEHMATRASMLTNDPHAATALAEVRIAAQMWKDLVDNDPYDKFIEIRDRITRAFSQLEGFTRELVTADGASLDVAREMR